MNVNITLGDSFVLVDPHVPDQLKKALSFWERSMGQDPKTGRKKMVGTTRHLYTCEEMGLNKDTGELGTKLVTMPGFAAKIAGVMRTLGIDVTWVDRRTTPPKTDPLVGMDKLREVQREGVYTAVVSGGGIITCPTGYGKTHMMGALIKAFLKESLVARATPLVLVVTPGKDLARKNYHDLCEILGGNRDVGMLTSDFSRPSQEVMVVTPESVGHIPMETVGLLIYDEVHTLSASRAEKLAPATKAVRYGFSATPTGRFDGADLVVEGMFGPVVYRKTFSEAVTEGAIAPIKVFWVTAPRPCNWREWGTRDSAYRHGLWQNVGFHQLVNQLIAEKIPKDWQTLMMADKLVHLNDLINHLSESTTVVHGTASEADLINKGLSNLSAVSKKDRVSLYEAIKHNELKRVLATGIYRVGVDFPELRVLINLAGMGSEIIAGQLPGRASRLADGKECGFIIDFWHPWDVKEKGLPAPKPGWILSDDMSREKCYRETGFEQVLVPSMEAMTLQ